MPQHTGDPVNADSLSRRSKAGESSEVTRIKIIVAEDHAAMRTLIASCLREAGYDVVEVSDGAVLWQQLHDGLLDDDNPHEPT